MNTKSHQASQDKITAEDSDLEFRPLIICPEGKKDSFFPLFLRSDWLATPISHEGTSSFSVHAMWKMYTSSA